jgi:hypothetical protein
VASSSKFQEEGGMKINVASWTPGRQRIPAYGQVSLGLAVLGRRAGFVPTSHCPFRDNKGKEVVMISDILPRSVVSVLGWVVFLALCIGIPAAFILSL